ncbi:hypothetical protein G9C85_17570 [Halorubellus sp. JP-L1]|uniref:OapC/ArvC family zinc-ribbon domain-containing protein n=1 Tax=Halorubellus sp. JP-L1 TaxID=2715753 RepID=UPI00140A1958|nr:Zn-ribbon containing protein [Halorubellus sp. JP-L1]NHN43430.1 hypothetical protein [Halorubellus sp. JP-L1]
MPHQCTECSRTFPDGSKEMLSGCPDCGGNKFQFKPADAVDVGAESGATATAESSGGEESAGAMSRAASTVRDLVGRGGESADASSATDPISSSPSTDEPSKSPASQQNTSQASASQSNASQSSASSTSSESTASNEGSWPKSGTEAYDTPSEKARRREDASGSRTETSPSVDAGGAEASVDAGGAEASVDAGGAEASAEDDSSITAQMNETEDDAQRSARSDVVSPDELPSHETPDAGGASPGEVDASERADRPPSRGSSSIPERQSAGDVASEPDEDSPDLDELREELNSQFESIKVLDPGKYELNLMELYDREEYIISLQEDGRYVIEVPESWRGDASPD